MVKEMGTTNSKNSVVGSMAALHTPVSVLPDGSVSVKPLKPVAPVAPAAPVAPFAPVGPVGPLAPAGPAGPVAPLGPLGPFLALAEAVALPLFEELEAA